MRDTYLSVMRDTWIISEEEKGGGGGRQISLVGKHTKYMYALMKISVCYGTALDNFLIFL